MAIQSRAITTARLTFEPLSLTAQVKEYYCNLFADEKLMHAYGSPAWTQEAIDQKLQYWEELWAKDVYSAFTVKDGAGYVGHVLCERLHDPEKVEMSMLFSQQGCGYGSEAIEAVMEYIPKVDSDVKMVYATIVKVNERMVHLLQKTGFTSENDEVYKREL